MGNVTVTIPQGRGLPIPADQAIPKFSLGYIVVD